MSKDRFEAPSDMEYESLRQDLDRIYAGVHGSSPLVDVLNRNGFKLDKTKGSKHFITYTDGSSKFLYFSSSNVHGGLPAVSSINNTKPLAPHQWMLKYSSEYSGEDGFRRMVFDNLPNIEDRKKYFKYDLNGDDMFADSFIPKKPSELKKDDSFKKKTELLKKQAEAVRKEELKKRQDSISKFKTRYNKYLNAGAGDILLERHLSKETLNDPRFNNIKHGCNRVKKDNQWVDGEPFVLTPFENVDGVCGGLRIYAKSYSDCGTKTRKETITNTDRTLYKSTNLDTADVLVLNETPIDSLSHAQLFPNSNYAYICFGGHPSDIGKEYFINEINRINSKRDKGIKIVLAFDNDKMGHQFKSDIGALLTEKAGYANAKSKNFLRNKMDMLESGTRLNEMIAVFPQDNHGDWNNLLKARSEMEAQLKSKDNKSDNSSKHNHVPTSNISHSPTPDM